MTTSEPWRCRFCKLLAKASANGCSQCLRHWEECQDLDFVRGQPKHPEQDYSNWYGKWHYQNKQGNSTPRTPRGSKVNQSWEQRPKSPRGGKKGRGKGKAKGKDKGQDSGGAQRSATEIPPEPPWNSHVGAGGTLAPLPPPTTPPPDPTPTVEEQYLKELLAALKKSPQEMPPDVKAVVQKHSIKEGQCASRDLYSAVDELSTARETLDSAILARHQLHIRWRNFLSEAVERWKGHAAHFQQEEQELTAQIESAKLALTQASKKFDASKAEVGGEVVDVDKTEESRLAMEADMRAQAHLGQVLHESLSTMKANLEQLSASAEAMVVEEAVSHKRQRTDQREGDLPLGVPSSSTPAMQPFANRDASFPLPDKA